MQPAIEGPAVAPQANNSQFSSVWNFSALQMSGEEAAAQGLRSVQDGEFGIDVSHWQLDRLYWNRLKKDGVRFAYIRVGSGHNVQDPNYGRNVAGCLTRSPSVIITSSMKMLT